MVWFRRSSDAAVGVHQIEQLASRFRLGIRKNSMSKIIMKEACLLSDDSTCSTRSTCSNEPSKHASPGKHVHFNEKVVILLPSMSIPTDTEADTIWFSSTEISNIKNGLRNIWKGSQINDHDFVAAVDLVQSLFAGNAILPDATEKLDKSVLDDAQVEQIEIYKQCARVLACNEGRGLERMHYGKSTLSKLGAKSLHVQRFVKSVLEVQDRFKDCTIDSRADAIAAQCQTLPSILWARISAEVDAEISRGDANPSTSNIFQNSTWTETLEV